MGELGMTHIDGTVRGLPKRSPSSDPDVIAVASGVSTGGGHTFTVPSTLRDGDFVFLGASSKNSDIGTATNNGTGASWNQLVYQDLSSNEEVRLFYKYASNESGSWTISQSGTGAAGYMVLRAQNPNHTLSLPPASYKGNAYSYSSSAITVPAGSLLVYMRIGCHDGAISPIGTMLASGIWIYEEVFVQQGIDEFVSFWYGSVKQNTWVAPIYRVGNQIGYQYTAIMYVT
jgi:hypothetical protein